MPWTPELLAMVEAYEREEAARGLQLEEDQLLKDEMNKPRPPKRRLQVNISVTSNSSAPTTTRIHIPLLQHGTQARFDI